MRIHSIALLAAAALGLVACGGDGEEPATAAPAERGDALVAFAQCMREQGIDFPDPKPGNGGVIIDGVGKASPEELRAAEEACAEERAPIAPPELSEAEQQEFKEAALANARCMREQGIDMPDPTFGPDGGAQIQLGAGGIDPNDPDFKAAQEKCADTLPEIGGEP